MAHKTIKHVVRSQKVDMGGIPILQPIPGREIRQIDPFLLIHHWRQDFAGNVHPSKVGVGPHPHRGFSPVTFIYSGDIHHRDSEGNDAIVGSRGTQWMFAGSGLTHSERPSAEMARDGGTLELIQFWVNAPAATKMNAPEYYPLQGDDTPQAVSPDGRITFLVASGELLGVSGPIPVLSPLIAAQVYFEEGGEATLTMPADQHTLLYVLDGQTEVNGTAVTETELAWMPVGTGDTIHLQSLTAGKAMLLSGAPLNEPVASYGPFVMNTSREIMQALEDAQMGRMGELLETFDHA